MYAFKVFEGIFNLKISYARFELVVLTSMINYIEKYILKYAWQNIIDNIQKSLLIWKGKTFC